MRWVSVESRENELGVVYGWYLYGRGVKRNKVYIGPAWDRVLVAAVRAQLRALGSARARRRFDSKMAMISARLASTPSRTSA